MLCGLCERLSAWERGLRIGSGRVAGEERRLLGRVSRWIVHVREERGRGLLLSCGGAEEGGLLLVSCSC